MLEHTPFPLDGCDLGGISKGGKIHLLIDVAFDGVDLEGWGWRVESDGDEERSCDDEALLFWTRRQERRVWR